MLQDYTHDADLARIRVTACDMDFTLLADDKTQPPCMPERIQALEEADVTFVASSGRPLCTLKAMFSESIDHMAFISDNGAVCAIANEVVSVSAMDKSLMAELLSFTLEAGAMPIVIGLNTIYLPEEARPLDAFMREFYHDIAYLEHMEDALDADETFIKFTVYYPEGDAAAQRDALFEPRFGDRLAVTLGGPVWVDIMNKGVSKALGIKALGQRLGVDLADIAAFGDGVNDIEMLEVVGHSFLVANADKSMEAHARYRVPSCNERGVATVLDDLIAAKTGIRPQFNTAEA